MCVSLSMLPGDRSSNRTESHVQKTILSHVSVTNYCLRSARHSPLEIPCSFGAHVSLKSIFDTLFSLYLSIYLINIYIFMYFFFRENNYSKSGTKSTKF